MEEREGGSEGGRERGGIITFISSTLWKLAMSISSCISLL